MSDSDSEDERKPAPAPIDDNADLHPLFWDSIPENADQNPVFEALDALKEESTPEERAENFKVQGNNKLKYGLKSKNRVLLREAVQFYTQGLELKCSSTPLNAVLLLNRAHVEGLLGNWRKALQDSLAAQQLDPKNIKSYFRGAKAAMHLNEFERCRQLCAEGRALDPKAPEFETMLKDAASKEAAETEKQRKLAAAREAVEGPARALVAAISSRGIRVTLPQVRLDKHSRPFLDSGGSLHWPSLIMFPESGQQDSIEDFHEGSSFKDHLDAMFGPDAPPLEWDRQGEYSRQNIELYYLSHAGRVLDQEQLMEAMQGRWPESSAEWGPKRYGEQAAHWRRVPEALSLGELMQRGDYVVPGLPLFFAVAKGTEYRQRFLAEQMRR